MDPVAFAAARLDEEEAAAKAIEDRSDPWPGQWVADGNHALRTYNGWVLAASVPVGSEFAPGVLAHIARHDPARVLREVEAGRRILARYQDCLARMEDPDYPQGVARDQVREYEDFVLPNLLVRWADHPDYDRSWAVE